MTVLRFDSAPLTRTKRLDNGWMRTPAILTRVGVFEYRMGDGSIRRELRPAEEVFKADSLGSFDGVPMTDDHPVNGLNVRNAKGLSVGTVTKVRRDGDLVAAELLITDGDTVTKVENGKRELSCGYECDTEDTAGVWTDSEGRAHPYDAIQRNIRGNHVAVVLRGRAGPEARVRLDAADGESTSADERNDSMTMKKIRLDGVEVEVPETTAQLIEKERATHAAEVEKLKARNDGLTEEHAKAKAELTQATDPKRFDTAVNARVDLLDKARTVLGATFKADGQTDRQIKVAVLGKLAPTAKLDGKSDAYVEARFDTAIEIELAKNPATEAAREALNGKDEGGEGGAKPRKDSAEDPRAAFENHVFRDRSKK